MRTIHRLGFVLALAATSLARSNHARAASSAELAGPKAPGLGGAFCGERRGDASSLLYNPASIARSSGFNINASVVGYSYSKETNYNAYGGKNVSTSFVGANSFLGFINPLKSDALTNLAVAFYVPENSDSDIELKLGKAPEFSIEKAYLAQKKVQQVYSGIAGMGWSLSEKISLGAALQGYYLTVSAQKFQQISLQRQASVVADGTMRDYLANLIQIEKANYNAVAMGARFGFLWEVSESLSWGTSLSKSFFVHTDGKGTRSGSGVATDTDGVPIPPGTLEGVLGQLGTFESAVTFDQADPFTRFPLVVRTGLSWTPAEGTKLNSDVTLISRNLVRDVESDKSYGTVANLAVGVEQVFSNGYFVAGGLFTDFDDNPPVSKNAESEARSRMDRAGLSLSFGLSDAESESSLTLIQTYGEGESVPVEVDGRRSGRRTTIFDLAAQFSLTKKI